MKLRNTIVENIVKPELRTVAPMLVATVAKYNKERHTATVVINNPYSGNQNTTLDEVPVLLPVVGHIPGTIPVGNQVVIGFLNNQQSYPVVIGYLDPMHAWHTREFHNKHPKSGVNVAYKLMTRKNKWNDFGKPW
jgi:hypothetical protein